MIEWILTYHINEWSSIAELALTVIGFTATIWNVIRSKKASQRAEAISKSVKQDMLAFNYLVELNTAINSLENIRRLHRLSAWEPLLEQYGQLHRQLIKLKRADLAKTEQEQQVLQSAITSFTQIQEKLEKVVSEKKPPPSVTALNSIVTREIGELQELLTGMQIFFKGV